VRAWAVHTPFIRMPLSARMRYRSDLPLLPLAIGRWSLADDDNG